MISDKKIKEFREEILANGLSEYPYNYTVFDEYDTWWIAAKVIELAQEGYEITHMNPNVLLDSILYKLIEEADLEEFKTMIFPHMWKSINYQD